MNIITSTKNSLFRLISIIIIAKIFITCSPESRTEPEELTARALEEFQDMRFGMFIHFGAFAHASGIWKQDTLPVSLHAEFIRRNFEIPRNEYHRFTSEFNPLEFNSKEIVDLAKKAGMNYIVITSKHHDGFAIFDSDYDDFNIKDGTPYERDLIRDLSNECKKQGMKLGFYYSHTRDWDEYHSLCRFGNHWDWDKDDSGRNNQIYLDTKVKPQLTELLTKYGEVFCLWFDTPYIISQEQAAELYKHVKSIQPACLVNSRIGKGYGDYGVLGDNQIPPGVVSGIWESPATMNHSWGFHVADKKWKSSRDMITQLVDLSSKNVNYLLNIGPMADGSIPEESIERLKDIGEWNRVNGEAIYKTKPSPWYQEMDGFRITTGPDALYLTIINPELQKITLYNLENEILKITSLRSGIEIPFKYNRLDSPSVSVLDFDIPKNINNETLPVLKIVTTGIPEVIDQPTQMSSGNVLLPARMANVRREGGELEISGIDGTIDIGEWPYFATRNWTNTGDYLEWAFNLIEPGTFDVQIINVSTARNIQTYLNKWNSIYQVSQEYNKVSFSIDEQSVTGEIKGANPIKSIRSVHRPEFSTSLGTVKIAHPGKFNAKLMANYINPGDRDGLVLFEVRLEKLEKDNLTLTNFFK